MGFYLEFRNYEPQLFSKSELEEKVVVAEFRTLQIEMPKDKIGLITVLECFPHFLQKKTCI